MQETTNFGFECTTFPQWLITRSLLKEGQPFALGNDQFEIPARSFFDDQLSPPDGQFYPFHVWQPNTGIGFVIAWNPNLGDAPGVIAFCMFNAFVVFDCDLTRILAECTRLLQVLGIQTHAYFLARNDIAFDLLGVPDDFAREIENERLYTKRFKAKRPWVNGEMVRWGTKNLMQVCCYPKDLELTEKPNAFKAHFLRTDLWQNQSPSDRWFRVELRVARQMRSKTFMNRGVRVDTIQDWYRHRRAILTNMVTDSVCFYSPPFNPKNPQRSAILPCWQALIDFIATDPMFDPSSTAGRSTVSPTAILSLPPVNISMLPPGRRHQKTYAKAKAHHDGWVKSLLVKCGLPHTAEYHRIVSNAIRAGLEMNAQDIVHQAAVERSLAKQLHHVGKSMNPTWKDTRIGK